MPQRFGPSRLLLRAETTMKNKDKESAVERRGKILHEKFTAEEPVITQTELFTTETTKYHSNSNGVKSKETMLALMALTKPPEAEEESEFRAYVERMRANAEGTLKAWRDPALRRRLPIHPNKTNAKSRKAYNAIWRELADH